jgi:hypothetical protein
MLMADLPSEGASRTTGGILRGNAAGNVFSHGDAPDLLKDSVSVWGKVKLYKSLGINPAKEDAQFVMRVKVGPSLVPILKKLARSYSPISSKRNPTCLFDVT